MNIITKAIKQTTWEELKAAAEAGTLGSIIQSGDLIPFTLKTGEEVRVRATQDEGGKWYFVLEDCLEEEHAMNKQNTNKGGWAACDMRRYLNKTIFSLLPDELQAIIAPTKVVQIVDGEQVETEDKLFLLSRTQVFGKGPWSDHEPEDTQLDCFTREKDRVKECGSNGTWFWWLRSANFNGGFYSVHSNGTYSYSIAYGSCGVALGFCLI